MAKTRKSPLNRLIQGAMVWLPGVGSSVPVKNIVALCGTRCCALSARIFHLLRLAFSAVWRRSSSKPTPPETRRSEDKIHSHISKNSTKWCCFIFWLWATKKFCSGFFDIYRPNKNHYTFNSICFFNAVSNAFAIQAAVSLPVELVSS